MPAKSKKPATATAEKKTTPKWEEQRSHPVDKSKRVAEGCAIDSKNIVKGTRRRKEVNYKDLVVSKRPKKEGTKKVTKQRKSINTTEERAKRTAENAVKATKKVSKKESKKDTKESK